VSYCHVMARDETDGEIVKKGKPGKPPRGFPWRLWMYAIVITAAAGAGGWFTWQYRSKANDAVDDLASCRKNLADSARFVTDKQKVGEDATKRATDCEGERVKDAASKKQLEGQLNQLSTNLNASKEELATLRAQRAETEKRIAAIEDIQKQFAKMIDTGQLKVVARRGSLVISLPSEVLFASGSADVSEKGQIAIIEIGVTLKKMTDRRFLVVGHTDDQPLKNSVFKDNWELSTARALMVTRTLAKAGMDPKNLIPAGAGEFDPLGKDRAKNRRIEIALLPAINELPPLPASLQTEGASGPTPPPAPAK
jgi:chemotaxis protein MotB